MIMPILQTAAFEISKPPFFYPPKEWRGNAGKYGGWQEAAAMKNIAVRHDLTTFEPSKKARPPPGDIPATGMNYAQL